MRFRPWYSGQNLPSGSSWKLTRKPTRERRCLVPAPLLRPASKPAIAPVGGIGPPIGGGPPMGGGGPPIGPPIGGGGPPIPIGGGPIPGPPIPGGELG